MQDSIQVVLPVKTAKFNCGPVKIYFRLITALTQKFHFMESSKFNQVRTIWRRHFEFIG